MKRAFALELQRRAAEIFRVPEAWIFAGVRSDEIKATEAAICYVCWLIGATPIELGQNFGSYDYHAAMRRCCDRRTLDKSYNENVGDLVFAAQRGFPATKVEAA